MKRSAHKKKTKGRERESETHLIEVSAERGRKKREHKCKVREERRGAGCVR